ncbi:hypothetical protein TH30_13860 [Thalassospira profundimaris]|uniref:Uncharacterized protein n=1 Tax=Thalassospira profundimaris TaxID=502049 RepID=A0A367WUD7_9PROT|nr:hypothetical protein TH30_13860 [Thalassospira profundimaris]
MQLILCHAFHLARITRRNRVPHILCAGSRPHAIAVAPSCGNLINCLKRGDFRSKTEKTDTDQKPRDQDKERLHDTCPLLIAVVFALP